jgi:hypothetical protein
MPGGTERMLLWRERGLMHTLGSATPRTVSAADLRRTAAGLEALAGRYAGTGPGADTPGGAVLVASERHVAGRVDWEAACGDGGVRAGSADLVLVRRRGASFAVDLAAVAPSAGDGWTGSVAGTVGPAGVSLEVRAVRAADGVTCDTGPLRLELRPVPPGRAD